MNTTEKKDVRVKMVEKYFRNKRSVEDFYFSFIMLMIILVGNYLGTSMRQAHLIYDPYILWEECKYSVLIFLLIFVLYMFFKNKISHPINLSKIKDKTSKEIGENNSKLSSYEAKITDSEDPTKSDIKIQLKIKKLQIEQEQLDFELGLLEQCV
ncbi:MAG: hypothetical protein WCH65_04265 [bacterium]